jgi:hypothetical protein
MMSLQEELAEAVAIVKRLPDTSRGGAFVADVERFVAYLGAMPDHKVSDITEAAVATVRREADRIVDCIEKRLEGGGDRSSVKQKLASSIYDVRRNMEQIDMWLRHHRADSRSE